MTNNTEPVPTIETIIEDFVQDYDADVAAIHQRCLVGAITIEQQTSESKERWEHHMKRAKARHERICAHERLDELNMISCRYGVFVDSTQGYEVATKAVSLKDIGERAKVLQTQLEGETMLKEKASE